MEQCNERPGLEQVLEATWRELIEGVRSARHAFHCPALATASASGPAVRTVVLREANPGARSLACHTDRRSPKYRELRENARAAWMFYDPQNKTQVRGSGSVTLHLGDELAAQRWAESAQRSRACYQAALGPGVRLQAEQSETLPPVEGFDQFVVLRCRLDRLDWLYLRGAGHWRASFNWQDQAWQGKWIAP